MKPPKQKQKGNYTGVYFNFVSEKWQAEICINSRKKVIGYAENETKAVLIRDVFILKNNLPNIIQLFQYPFKEGEDYYTIENNEIVKSTWDNESENLFCLLKNYYSNINEVKKYLK